MIGMGLLENKTITALSLRVTYFYCSALYVLLQETKLGMKVQKLLEKR